MIDFIGFLFNRTFIRFVFVFHVHSSQEGIPWVLKVKRQLWACQENSFTLLSMAIFYYWIRNDVDRSSAYS